MAAERALPPQHPQSRLESGDGRELGEQYGRWADVFADAGWAGPELDVLDLCVCVSGGVVRDLVGLSGDEGVDAGGDGGAVEGWVGGAEGGWEVREGIGG